MNTFTRSEVLKVVFDLIVKQVDCDVDDVTPTAHLVEDVGFDSIDLLELVLAAEEHFEVDVPDEPDRVRTVQDAADLVVELLGPRIVETASAEVR